MRGGAHEPRALGAEQLARLAMTVLQDVTYPWPSAAVLHAEIDHDVLVGLMLSGWLRPAPQSGYEIPHDRLLNYAVARGLVDAYRIRELAEPRLIESVRQLLLEHDVHSGRRLGYVPMDVFQLLLDVGAEGAATCGRLLEALDDIDHIARETLYQDLLVTLGSGIVPVLFGRLQAITGRYAVFRQRPIIDAINQFDTDDVRAGARQLLSSDHPELQRAALRILAQHAEPGLLDQLWELHCHMQRQPQAFGDERHTFRGSSSPVFRLKMDNSATIFEDPS